MDFEKLALMNIACEPIKFQHVYESSFRETKIMHMIAFDVCVSFLNLKVLAFSRLNDSIH